VPTSGFYVWKDVTPQQFDMFGQPLPKPKTKKEKEIYYINLKDDNLMAFAGLWDEWVDHQTGEVIPSFTIITTQANELVKPIHPERMPAKQDRDKEKLWLSDNLTKEELLDLSRPFESDKMKALHIPGIVDFPNPI